LYDTAATVHGNFTYLVSSSTVVVSNAVTGSSWQLDNTDNCNAYPSTGGNFLVLNSAHGYQAGGGSWLALSDARIKTETGAYAEGLDQIRALRPVLYRYKGNDALGRNVDGQQQPSMHAQAAAQGTRYVGLIAQEAETVMPGMVGHRQGWIDGEEVEDLRTLDNSELVYALINAVKQLAEQIERIEARMVAPAPRNAKR
jgi:hypothetical protein